ncbi:YjbF family lipoprotein [Pseudooceanicola sp.]|uniref:YjbF family lipoprotein n=1 Tax=Pseudooceanicola sp. TaxID=1914328 RepID=UPI0035C6F8EA
MSIWRALGFGTLVLALAACGNDPDKPKVGLTALKGVLAKVGGGDEAPASPTADQLRAAVTPEYRAQSGNQPILLASSLRVPVSSLMVMAGENGDVRTYFSPDQISFSLRNGVVVASRGLGEDLLRADVSQVQARIQEGAGQAVRIHHYLDGENQNVTRRYNCLYETVGGEVVETCTGQDARFTNRYALNSDGKIVVSVQWVSPKLGSYRLEDLGVGELSEG